MAQLIGATLGVWGLSLFWRWLLIRRVLGDSFATDFISICIAWIIGAIVWGFNGGSESGFHYDGFVIYGIAAVAVAILTVRERKKRKADATRA